MTTIYRTRIALTGWEGAPGLNTMYWTKGTLSSVGPEEVENWHDDIAAAFVVVEGYCVDNFTWTVESTVDVIDVESGNITGAITSAGGDITDSQGTGVVSTLSRATQVTLAAKTDVWEAGRRLQGRLFLGPVNAEALGEDGQVNSTCRGALQDAFNLLNTGTGPRWAVYSRPGPGPKIGYYGDVVTTVARMKPGVLRSRRD